MPTAVTMKGLLEPIILHDEFMETVNALNISSAKGNHFVIGERDDNGEPIAMALPNILTITGIDD